ncbi:MAG: DNA-3-methyladenine glycosylase I [Firmicutes bacterium]|nr:DNA-3-methyladenine glycosylase I [Bacillota bacterium]
MIMKCKWASNEILEKYHDEEWGKVTKDEKVLYEFLVLESAQAGLNWLTILKKREGYRKSYDDFDYIKVSKYDEAKIQELLSNPEIVRNKLKVRASVNNAQKFIEIQKEFGSFYNYIWSFVDGEQVINTWKEDSEVPASTELSDRLSKDMKKRGFKFVGTTIMYSYLQAVGVINDHIIDCECR